MMKKHTSTKTDFLSKTQSQISLNSQKSSQKESNIRVSPERDSNISSKKSCVLSSCSLKEDDGSSGSKESLNYVESRTAVVNSQGKKWIDIYGVRICPAIVKFDNTFENQSYQESVSVQNISECPVTVRILTPRALSFRVTPLEWGHMLAPGLKIQRHVHYKCTKSTIVHSSLPIYINDNVVQLPLEASKGQAFVDIIPTSIKFGRVDIGCKPIERKIRIKNVSFCATKFLVDVGTNELDLHIGPMKGWIRPHNSVTVRVKLLALREGIHSSELWISTDLGQTRIPVEVEACRRSLLVQHPNTISEFTLVDFPATFYGCQRYQTLVVHNVAASSSAFVVLADYGSEGQEPFREAREKAQSKVKMFDIEPVEGRLKPFEGRIFTFWFSPKMIEGNEQCVSKDKDTDLNDYLCAVRIKRIQVDESGIDSVPDSYEHFSLKDRTTFGNKPSNYDLKLLLDKETNGREPPSRVFIEEISVLFYVYGEAEIPSLSIIPDALYFPDTLVGATVVKVVQLTNKTNQLLAFQYSKIPFFEVIPDFKKLSPKTSYDVTVKLCARNIGFLPKILSFNILAEKNATDKQDFHVVNHINVRIFGNVKSQNILPKPTFNLGITPMITNEVGFLTDGVTFASRIKKPRCALTMKAKSGRPWHQTDATIAFPNDRPRSLRPRPTDTKALTIYKGLPRYIPPVDESETLTYEKMVGKKAHNAWVLNYIRGTAASFISKDNCCHKKFSKGPSDPPIVLFPNKEVKQPSEVFVPMTFVQLYRIRVYPEVVSFGSVTVCKSCSQLLTIVNDNDFKISARMVPLTSGINVQTLDNFIVAGKSEGKIMLTFQRESLGRYSGTVSCVINGFHSFDIAVVAEVVHRSLTVTPKYVQVKIPDAPFADLCVPVSINNPLNIPVAFSWAIPEESPIKIEPVFGVIPKLEAVWCGVFFEPSCPNYKLHPLNLVVDGTVCLQLKTGVTLPKTNVYFLEPILNLGNIPINLKTVREFMIFNPDFSDAMFVVLSQKPVNGVKVTVIPSVGTIKAKSCHSLFLHITVQLEMPLNFIVFMTLQSSTTIDMKVNGYVVYPEVEVTPKFINLHRVPCNSVVRTVLIAENKSKTTAQVGFKMDEYAQFKVSLSKRYHDPGFSSYSFTLDPGALQKFYLHFVPKDLASYEFYLPITINNMPLAHNISRQETEVGGKSNKGGGKKNTLDQGKNLTTSHQVLVNVVVLKPSLTFSDLELDFSSVPEVKSFTIENTSNKSIGVFARPENNQGLFDICVDGKDVGKDSSELVLDPGSCITYVVTFTGISPGLFVSDVEILTTFEEYSCVYNTVRLTAEILWPCTITSSVKEVYFQPVPLNVEIRTTLQLKITKNQDTKDVAIGFEITDPYKDLFRVDFPKGNTVVGNVDCIMPISITFKSKFPVALRKKITFKDGKQSQCVINMIATSDNCLLTTYGYLKSHDLHQPKVSRPEKASCTHKTVVENERVILPKQKLMRQTMVSKVDSSSEGSGLSTVSLKTLCSLVQSNIVKESVIKRQSLKDSVLVGKEQRLVSNSDIELSLQLSEKEESEPSVDKLLTAKKITQQNEEIVFPMFPLRRAVNEHVIFMNKTLNAVQQWAYEQVFCCSYNPIFGNNSFSSFSVVDKGDYSRSSRMALKNVFDALERICGRRIRKYFTPIDKIPEENTAKAIFTHNLYRQLVHFMTVQGALMAHVEPKYLMVYDEYCFYQRSKVTSVSDHKPLSIESKCDYEIHSELMSADNFLSISVQCWLDLFLQMFKTLILAPAVGVSYSHRDNLRQTARQHSNDEADNFGRAEEVLLIWLTHHYNSQRTLVWPNKSPPPRTVTNFDTDLEDGLVLTTITAAYCPYLTELYFHNMCIHPSTTSQAYHNTTCLCMAWGRIRLGFSITPRDFVHSNSIKMLLLVTYLYKILPSYKPEATINFRGILNAGESHIVTLENDEEASVTYHVEIVQRSSNFILDNCEDSFVLKRKSKQTITVNYVARNTIKAEAILLLCGACMPPKFGRNYVFKLEGCPVKLPVSSAFTIVSPLNTPIDTKITVESPHLLDFKAEFYSYDLWVTYSEPQPGNINALSWAKERKHKIPRRLYFSDNSLIVSSAKSKIGSGKLAFKVCCFSNIVRDYWLIFRNADIGDFIVKLQSVPCKPEPTLTLQVVMKQETKCNCTCERALVCNRTTTVHVPCCNFEQWSAVKVMFDLTISPEEKEFWDTYIESNIGFRLLQWILEEKEEKFNDELEKLFQKSKTYKIVCPSQHVTCAPSVYIPDVKSKSSLPLELHLDEKTSSHSTLVNLTSNDGSEIRSYNLQIIINKM
ncbi:cilia- and flagella-associated protein 47-like [Macrosteles quadrilineatus]|uniref:cilia- and flagella-associated protein 47-like n=1 Tax=Macrosteles quadrilineatus TaxID=74068 RepID=UPI0023E2A3CF|nr:cilia- and flagella-associated protein 47-like [Macrosteles quadrilineatus]